MGSLDIVVGNQSGRTTLNLDRKESNGKPLRHISREHLQFIRAMITLLIKGHDIELLQI